MSAYSCPFGDCLAKKRAKTDGKDLFIPLRLLVCGHSVCEICILQFCQKRKDFIKCGICSFNTSMSEDIHRNVIQYESDIKKWLDPTSASAQVMRLDIDFFPIDMHQIGSGVDLGLITATKTAEMIDLDDDMAANEEVIIAYNPVNSLYEDDNTVKLISTRIPNTAKKSFHESVDKGIKAFTELSTNHTSVKRLTDETKDWFKKSKSEVKELFHKMYSTLQMREKEFMEEMDKTEDNRLKDLKIHMNEILSKRSELKGKLFQCPQTQTDKDRTVLKKLIDQLVANSNVLPMNSPQNEFKLFFDPTVEEKLKIFGSIDVISTSISVDVENGVEESVESENAIELSSDESDAEETIDEIPKSDETMNKEVVNVLVVDSPNKFYVQKTSDKEKFDSLKSQIQSICRSVYYHAPAVEVLPLGEQIFAYSLKMKCWCRATLTVFRPEVDPKTREYIYLADVVLIDYGISETVHWYNVREKRKELFDPKKWPPFAYKCSLYAVRPKKSHNWSERALNLFNLYVNNNQLVLFDFETTNGYKFVDLMHYDVPEVTYQIPSVIEVLYKNDCAVLQSEIDFGGYCRQKTQPIVFKAPEIPELQKTISVVVAQIETPDLFYVQPKKDHSRLMTLWSEMNKIYTEENANVYTYYCPQLNTPCAAIFEGDGKYYRALVINRGKTVSDFEIQFVDFGSKQMVNILEMRLMKDELMSLPMQSIPCGLMDVDPAYRFKWTEDAIKYFRLAVSDDKGPQVMYMTVQEVKQLNTNQDKLMVVLRSFDGNNELKLNQALVERGYALSTGRNSKSDNEGMTTPNRSAVSSPMNTSSGSSSRNTPNQKPAEISALLVLKDLMERHLLSKADKRSSLIKVRVTSVRNPSEFYVQIERKELNQYFEVIEKRLHKEYNSPKHRFLGDVNFIDGDLCAFKATNDWRRGKVITRIDEPSGDSPPKEPAFRVFDIDYGNEHDLKVSQMRRLVDNFQKDGSLALMCTLFAVKPSGGDHWTDSAKDDFNEFIDKFKNETYILVKGMADMEPISVRLYSKETIIPSAFSKARIEYKSINEIFIDKGLALPDRSVPNFDDDDDQEINTTIVSDKRPEMPFSLMSVTGSALGNLEQRFSGDTVPQSGGYFEYLAEEYPREKIFFGIPSDLTFNEFVISFRVFYENTSIQPLQHIERCIQETISEKGELGPFVGTITKGNACTAYFDYDKTWNRAEILGVAKDSDGSNLVVRYVDYGNQVSILVDKLSSQVFGRNASKLALKCQLVNINAINPTAEKEIRNIIYTKVLDSKCRFVWENFPKQPMRASIEIPVNDSYQSLVSYLENENLLSANRTEDNDSVENVLNIEPMVERTYGLYPIIFDSNRFYEVVVSHPLVNKYAFFQATEVNRPLGKDSIITSEHDSYVTMLDRMREDVESYPSVQILREGHPCLALFDDECWYRGLITSVDKMKESAEIFFVDFGNTDWVPISNLKEIPKIHMRPKAHAFLCQMFNIRPAGNRLWSMCQDLAVSLTEHLTNKCCGDNRLWAKFKNNKYPLIIDLYLPDSEDPTEPGRHVFQEFVSKGLVEYIEPRDVWRKPIKATESYRNSNINIKKEPKFTNN